MASGRDLPGNLSSSMQFGVGVAPAADPVFDLLRRVPAQLLKSAEAVNVRNGDVVARPKQRLVDAVVVVSEAAEPGGPCFLVRVDVPCFVVRVDVANTIDRVGPGDVDDTLPVRDANDRFLVVNVLRGLAHGKPTRPCRTQVLSIPDRYTPS